MAGHRSMTVVAHHDDDLLFVNPAVQRDIESGWSVRTVVVTAGDAGLGADYWLGREEGARAAYAHMAGVSDDWTQEDAGVPWHDVTVESLVDAPEVGLVFLRLPDGNLDGSGFDSTGHVSLQRLWSGAAPEAATVGGGETYSADDLVAALASLLAAYAPDVTRMLDFVGTFGDGDHSDHHASAYFAHAAHRAAGGRVLAGHVGYPVSTRPGNLSAAQTMAKRDTFHVYAVHDPHVPQPGQPPGVYGPWLARRYTAGYRNVADLAEVTASSANAVTGQVAARAVDGYVLGHPDDHLREWATVGGGAGSWLRLSWGTPHTLRAAVLYDRPNADDHVVAGTLTPDGGPDLATGELGQRYQPTLIDLPGGPTNGLTFTVDDVSATTVNIGLAEIEVLEANIAPEAAVTVSSENAATGQLASRAVDGHAAGYPDDPQHEWATIGGGAGSWIQLAWATPRLVHRVRLFDRPNEDDHVAAARLSFSDGSSVEIGPLDDSGAATDVVLAPRLVSWLTVTVTEVGDTTQNVGLAEIQVEGD